MDFKEFGTARLGINSERFGSIYSFVDFGNVNYWYEKDRRDWDGKELTQSQKLIVDIKKLAEFIDSFSVQKRFYYGFDIRAKRSWHIVFSAEKSGFVKVTKPIQFIRHYLGDAEVGGTHSKLVKTDVAGRYIEIPKSNFDVEITVDAIRLAEKYETFCLFSGDSDFAKLTQFLKRQGKKVVIIAAGHVFHTLKEGADLYINAQQIKAHVAAIKETSPR